MGVLVFVVIGRHSHHHGETLGGILSTWWPFAVGVLGAWTVLGLLHRTGMSLKDGAIVVVVTVALGMVLRVLAGQGTAPAFIGVACAFLYLFFGGWRLVSQRIAKR